MIIVLAVSIGCLPEPKQRETGTIADAYNIWIAHRQAYGRAPCLRNTLTPCPDPTVRMRCYLP